MNATAPSPLRQLLETFRETGVTHRERGTYFEELALQFFRTEPLYKELYTSVQTYGDWAAARGLDKRDVGIDLVAKTTTGEVHAIQCKLYAANYKIQKSDIDSFFTASGKKPFSHRIIIATTDHWSEHAEDALRDQQPPVNKIDLTALENSVIDWAQFEPTRAPVLRAKKTLRPHQRTAVERVTSGLEEANRGKLIMACGTGKTFTSLKLAEELAGEGKRVLFLVPSLALLSQTLTEWTQESGVPLQSFAVCSDSDVGKKRTNEDDAVQTFVHELQYPATTDPERLAKEAAQREHDEHMTVVFSTYHSIAKVHDAQHQHGLPDFDLIICDEAHRTTGATWDDQDESAFVRVHDAAYVRGTKRLYMTATPRIFGDGAKASAEQDNVTLCSMDDEDLYGSNLYVLTFSEAVKRDLLVDYKVIVLSIEESHVSRRIQNLLKDDNNQLRVDDAAKIVGCWKALSKQGMAEELTGDDHPMKRAVAFCQVIRESETAKRHKVASVNIANMFQAVVEAYQESDPDADEDAVHLQCEAAHVDGSMNASEKESKIDWLKATTDDNVCRILSNVRCLSEGVDVPALDAVLFLTPRNSQVDVVQSVGRVMRKSPGKTRGYIVLPVVIPAGMEAHDALNDNDTYRVVWQVLQALRSHDDRFDAMVNKLELTGPDPTKMEVIAITDKIQKRTKRKGGKKELARKKAKKGRTIGKAEQRRLDLEAAGQTELQFEIGEIERAIYAKLVKKVGNRHHWEEWANDIAQIARTHIDRLTGILENPDNVTERNAFEAFAEELRDDLNDSIPDEEIVEMLAQHLVTRPVFDALFAGHSFVGENSMSKAMQGVLDVLDTHRLDKETRTLQAFYESVKLRAEGIESAEGKQKIIVELYDKFFQNAFPRLAQRLGIVYTPVEIVDFILHSVDHLLREEFGETLGSEGVHILDPFTGTGTFITRLLQSGLIAPEDLPRKFAKEIHANEIVLLAYYIAAINIEATYAGLASGEYRPFEGICLTDTFQMYEKDDLVSEVLADNSARRARQKDLDIRVIVGNPPYSVGQGSQNDNNQNVAYPSLDARIADTYVARSGAALSRNLYDSYVRAIRWASDRVGQRGIVGFVTNANFVDASTTDGMRRCLAEEFSSLYILHLRGNQRTAGERSRKEGGKVFGSGSRAPVAISLFVKNPGSNQPGGVFFHDIGDYLTKEEKLASVASFSNVAGVAAASPGWELVKPDEHGDWVNQRRADFDNHIPTGVKDKKDDSPRIFDPFSLGVVTNRDAWAYAFSRRNCAAQIERMVAVYNRELERFNAEFPDRSKKERLSLIKGHAEMDPTKISWSRGLKNEFSKGTVLEFDQSHVVRALYRPFTPMWMYFDRTLNEMVLQMPRLFGDGTFPNRAIGVSSGESRSGFSVLMTDRLPSLHAADMVGSQWFPLYVYDRTGASDEAASRQASPPPFAFDRSAEEAAVGRYSGSVANAQDGITSDAVEHFQAFYPDLEITNERLFYYVYGILHSPEYRDLYAENLGKELPRIPRVTSAEDFLAFSDAGRRLGDMHVGFERAPEFPATVDGPPNPMPEQLRVDKMKFGKGKDQTTIHYNAFFVVRDIPLEAYDYVVNGKPAIKWVMERQAVTTDKASGIVKDANLWATETVGDPRYPLSLLLRVITVSLETMKIIRSLPPLDIEGD